MPARVCAYIEAVYTLFCDTLTKRSNNKHRDYPLPPPTTPPSSPPSNLLQLPPHRLKVCLAPSPASVLALPPSAFICLPISLPS